MICPQCHEDNQDNVAVCAHCGAPLDGAAESEPKATPLPSVISESLEEVRSLKAVPEVLAAERLWAGEKTPAAEGGRSAHLAEAVPQPEVVTKEKLAQQVPVPEAPSKGDLSDKIPVIADDAVPEAARLKDSGSIPAVYDAPEAPKPRHNPRAAKASVADEAAELFEGHDLADLTTPVEADFSGLETIVDSSYVPPAPARTGDTMEIPVIKDEAPRARQFVGGDDPKLAKQRSKEQKKMDRALAKEKKKAARAAKKAAGAAAAVGAGAVAVGAAAAETAQAATVEAAEGVVTAQATGSAAAAARPVEAAPKQTPVSEKDVAPEVQPLTDEEFAAAVAPVSPEAEGAPRSSRAKTGVIVALIIAVLLAAAAGVTYYLEIWGGKTVPSVVGQMAAEAQATLEGDGFAVNLEQHKSDEAEGLVLGQSPDGGRADEGSTITLTVAVSRVVPAVVDTPVDDALAALSAEGYGNVVQQEQKSNAAEGTVIAVSPEAGTKAPSTQEITLTVAIPYLVPDVAGMGGDAAKEALEAEGYDVTVAYTYDEEIEPGAAVSTVPAAGTKLNSGEEVTLFLA